MCERAKQDKHALREIITQQIIIRFTFCSRITRKRESEIEVKLKIEGHNDDKEEEEDDDRMYGKTTGKIRNRRRRRRRAWLWKTKQGRMHEKCAAAKKLSSSINDIIIAMQKLLQKFFCFYEDASEILLKRIHVTDYLLSYNSI